MDRCEIPAPRCTAQNNWALFVTRRLITVVLSVLCCSRRHELLLLSRIYDSQWSTTIEIIDLFVSGLLRATCCCPVPHVDVKVDDVILSNSLQLKRLLVKFQSSLPVYYYSIIRPLLGKVGKAFPKSYCYCTRLHNDGARLRLCRRGEEPVEQGPCGELRDRNTETKGSLHWALFLPRYRAISQSLDHQFLVVQR